MKIKSLNIILVLGALLVTMLVATQYFWVKKQLELNDLRFEYHIKNALGEVGKQLQIINEESVSQIYPVERISNNQFVVMINEMVNPPLLDSLISNQFRKYEIEEPYVYGIYDCHTNQVQFNNKLLPAQEFTISSWDPTTHNFGLIFPDLNSFTNQLRAWGLSLVVFLAVLLIILYLIYTIFQQKKLADIKTDFVNNMTHELKTPIATIGLVGESLNKDKVLANPEKVKKYAQIVLEESRKLKSQVEKVLEVALFDANKMKLEESEFVLDNVIDEVVRDFLSVPSSKELNIDLSLKTNKAVLKGDRNHIKNVFSNLIDNAIKYNERQPKINITSSISRNSIEVKITDNGIGISATDKEAVFEKFYRVPKGNLHDVKGFGLGLYYVKNILELHNACIEVLPQDQGTCFKLKFERHEKN